MEIMLSFIKSLPLWLGQVVEVLIVALVFMACFTFLIGVWCGLRIIGNRSKSIREISFFPPKISFQEEDNHI